MKRIVFAAALALAFVQARAAVIVQVSETFQAAEDAPLAALQMTAAGSGQSLPVDALDAQIDHPPQVDGALPDDASPDLLVRLLVSSGEELLFETTGVCQPDAGKPVTCTAGQDGSFRIERTVSDGVTSRLAVTLSGPLQLVGGPPLGEPAEDSADAPAGEPAFAELRAKKAPLTLVFESD